MIDFPIAKINLGLRVTAKRPDGYHDIETVFYPVGLCDALEFVVSGKSAVNDSIATSGFNIGVDPEENLVIRTVKRIRERYTFPYLRIHLHKGIPTGAGLGGGSSDSASILITINRHFGLEMPEKELNSIALELGSDCPFFLEGVPVVASGRGEILKPVIPVLSGYHLVLLNPGVGISTREAYQNVKPAKSSEGLPELIAHPINEWRKLIMNDFEDFAFKKHAVIGKIKAELYENGALFSLMSGSGSSVYGIFRERPQLAGSLKRYLIYEGKL